MNVRIRLTFIALLALLPFLTGSANAIDSSALASQLAGEGCSYVTGFTRQDSYKFFSRYDPELLACRRNTTLFKKLFTGSIGCRLHAAYCLYEAPSIDSEARTSLHEALTVDPESYDYAGIRGSDLQLAAVRVLGKHRDESSVKPLTEALSSGETVQGEALDALKKYGTEAVAAFDAVATLTLSHQSYYTRWLETLAAIDPVRSIPLLSEGLKRDNPRERQQAMKLLREAQSFDRDADLLLAALSDPATSVEAARTISREALQNEEIATTLHEILSANATDSTAVRRDEEIFKALSTFGELSDEFCSQARERVQTTTVFKIFESALGALSSGCGTDNELNQLLINKLGDLPPSMRTKAVQYLGSQHLNREQYNTLFCYANSLSNDLRKAIHNIPETRHGNCTLYEPGDLETRSATLDLEQLRENVYREEQLRSLLLKWIAHGGSVAAFTVEFTKTRIEGSKSTTSSYRQKQRSESGTIIYRAPAQLRIESLEKHSTERKKLEIINGTHQWSVTEGLGPYGTTKVYEDIYSRPAHVDTKPLIQVKPGRRGLISGLSGRYVHDFFFSDLEYVESFAEGDETLHLLEHRKPHGSERFTVSEQGLLRKHEQIWGSSNPARWDDSYRGEQTREITVYRNFKPLDSVPASAWEYSPPRGASWTRRIRTRGEIKEEKIQ